MSQAVVAIKQKDKILLGCHILGLMQLVGTGGLMYVFDHLKRYK